MSLKEVIKETRIKKGLTHEDVAAQLCVIRPTYSNMEMRGSVRSCYIVRLCKALGITPNELFEWEEERKLWQR